MVADVLLRPARQAEAALLTELALRSKGHWGYDAAFVAACRDELTIEAAQCDGVHVIVAERAGRVGGYYQLAGEPPRGELADLFIDPPAIGLGIGGALLRHARDHARSLGYELLTIDADPHAEAFYVHGGAVRSGETPSGSIPGRMLPRLELSVGADS